MITEEDIVKLARVFPSIESAVEFICNTMGINPKTNDVSELRESVIKVMATRIKSAVNEGILNKDQLTSLIEFYTADSHAAHDNLVNFLLGDISMTAAISEVYGRGVPPEEWKLWKNKVAQS